MSDGVTQDGGDGKWRDSKGNVYNTFSEAKASNDGGGSSSGGGGGGGGGIIVLIILAIPALAAKIAGVIFGFMFKLGIVGKFLQTIIFSVVCVVIAAFATGMFSGDVLAQLGIPVFLMAALWYWLFHYDEIKKIPIKNFSNYATLSFSIVIYGFVFNFVFAAGIAGMLFGENAAKFVFFIVLLASFAIAIIIYLIKIKPYREEAAKTRTNVKLKKTILVIAAAYLVLTLGWNLLTEALGFERKEINIDLTGRSKMESSDDVKLSLLQDADFFDSPSDGANVIGTIKKGQTVKVMFDMKGTEKYFPVEYESKKGYVIREYLKAIDD